MGAIGELLMLNPVIVTGENDIHETFGDVLAKIKVSRLTGMGYDNDNIRALLSKHWGEFFGHVFHVVVFEVGWKRIVDLLRPFLLHQSNYANLDTIRSVDHSVSLAIAHWVVGSKLWIEDMASNQGNEHPLAK